MKTSKLTGAALDWAVAKCEGYAITSDGISVLLEREEALLILGSGSSPLNYSPSTDWSLAGPIIERKKLELHIRNDPVDGWSAFANYQVYGVGPTPLIAAMRCYVASKLGAEVQLPEGLK